MSKCFTVAIAGVGTRGADTYAPYQRKHPDRMKIVALAEPRPDRLAPIAKEFGVPPERCFSCAEDMLAQPKLADVMIIATQDSQQHVCHAIPALESGYDLIVEKPISNHAGEMLKLRDKARETGRMVIISHVLRYTPFYSTIKEILESGAVGAPVTIHALENVGYWHQAHSFVRGNWANSHVESPMILAKSCHDLDIILWLMGKDCTHVSSFGSLFHFRPENAPAGAALRCLDGCKAKKSCPYDAESFYMGRLRAGCTGWPCDMLTPEPTEESVMKAIKHGPYGRCVYACDNDVVDHQVVNMLFEGGETAAFTMTGFTANNNREIKVCCTMGEILGDVESGIIQLTPFGGEQTKIDLRASAGDLDGHAGGDHRMMDMFFDSLEGNTHNARTTIEASVQSHLMAFAAERSRLENGRSVKI